MPQDAHEASLTWRVTPDLMCILDRAGRFEALNPAWRQTLGWDREDMAGKPYLDFLHPGDVERSMKAFDVVKEGTPVLRFENRYLTRDGGYRWLSWVAVPDGDRFYCTARDITDDKERIETIDAQRVEAELREQFLAVLGHDLRNPLAAISSGTRLIARRVDDEKLKSITRQMQSSVMRMTEMINNLMDLTRVRLGSGIGLDIVAAPDLSTRLEDTIGEIRLANPDVQIESDIDFPEPVACDAPRIIQVLSNLLGNAVTHGDTSAPIRVAGASGSGRLRISVTSEGAPLPEEISEKLFQPFYRLESGGMREGLGLGLYISTEIARAHQGQLTVSSADGGNTFTIDVPC